MLEHEEAIDAYNRYLLRGIAIRSSIKQRPIPNIEFKFPQVELDNWTLEARRKVILNRNSLFIGPLELQIPFKLFLGSGKDIEDARHLYKLFRHLLDTEILYQFAGKLKVIQLFNRHVR